MQTLTQENFSSNFQSLCVRTFQAGLWKYYARLFKLAKRNFNLLVLAHVNESSVETVKEVIEDMYETFFISMF